MSETEFFGVVGGLVISAIGVCMIRFAAPLLDYVERLRIGLFGERIVATLPSLRTPRAGGVMLILAGAVLTTIAIMSAINGR